MALHGMALLTAVLFLFSGSASASRPCFEVLENKSPQHSRPSPLQREAANSLELLKLEASDPAANIHELKSSLKIEELSRINLKRLEQRLRYWANVRSEENDKIDVALRTVEFVAVRRLEGQEPIFKPENDFYNKLTGNHRTVGVKWGAKPRGNDFGVSNQFASDIAIIDRKFTAKFGFVLPEFDSAAELIELFAEWDPQILEHVIQSNRMNLPSNVNSVPTFIKYIHSETGDKVFSEAELYQRLAPLRTQLHRYLLTDSDAETLSRLALKLHILKVVEGGETLEEALVLLKARPAKALHDALKAVGLDSLQMRIPLTITAENVTILRHREIMQQQPQMQRLGYPIHQRGLDPY
jgi:hypothetical protein